MTITRPLSPVLAGSLILGAVAATAQPGSIDGARSGIDAAAERYVRVALAFDEIDDSYVDAFTGPEAWLEEAAAEGASLERLQREAEELSAALARVDAAGLDQLERLRLSTLDKRVEAMQLRMDMASGRRLPFDEESEILFDAVAPDYEAEHFQAILDEIDALIPGDAPLPERVEAFRQRFVIPDDRLAQVFAAAIDECRSRTLEHIDLPEGEHFEIEYVTDKPWSGYNWYEGDYFSLIQINTDLPIFISRAVDLGCHEGYPGHHTYNVLLERDLVGSRGWSEFRVNPLYGPQSLISEGSANFGIDLAFPGDERALFARDVLFPLAGLDPTEAERYYRLLELLEELSYAGNEAARDYLNGDMTANEAADWLVEYTLTSPERARQRVDFFDTYRSYVLNYNLGRDLVRDYVERVAGDDPEARWDAFESLLSSPMSPSDLNL